MQSMGSNYLRAVYEQSWSELALVFMGVGGTLEVNGSEREG